MANKFNEFFTNVAHNILKNIHPTDRDLTKETITQNANIQFPFSFTDNPLTMGKISEAINDLKPKNSLDFEGISTNFIKKIPCPY